MNRQGPGKIEWTDWSWSIVTGCSKLCPYCYAAAMARRFRRSFEPTCHPERLGEPGKLRQPSKIFVASAGDLFDPAIPFDFVAQVWQAMWQAPQHTYQILTKQPARMREFVTKWYKEESGLAVRQRDFFDHVWLGTSLTSDDDHAQAWQLLQTPAALRFISYEPALGPLDLDKWELICRTWRHGSTIGTYLDWVIVGAQTGPRAIPPQRDWVESLREQCQRAGVPYFEKGSLSNVVDRPLVQQWPEAGER
jgi:protein gp37